MSDRALRDHVAALLGWEDAHAGIDRIVEGVPRTGGPRAHRGSPTPSGSCWSTSGWPSTTFSTSAGIRATGSFAGRMTTGRGETEAPPPPGGGELAALREDRDALIAMALDPKMDLFARIPHGTGQTYLRELLLVADHTSYHLGQMVVVRRALGIWG